jgi:Protein of unknown function (Hypoth_ymh)
MRFLAITHQHSPALGTRLNGSIDSVNPEDAKRELSNLRAELATLAYANPGVFVSWELRARSALARALGEHHHILERFREIDWFPPVGGGSLAEDIQWFQRKADHGRGMLEAAIAEVGMLADDVPVADESGIDAELWEHVAPEIRTESWVKVARGALIFTEDRIRKWAGRRNAEVSKDLAIAIFGQNGNFRMGQTDGEMQGWQLFAQGIAQALRNVDTHRIQDRPDLKRYALGVVGACSLLLTQMRYEHGNGFQDTSPASAVESDDNES